MLTNEMLKIYFISITLLLLVLICSVTDIRSRRIPNQFLIFGLSLAMICHGVTGGMPGLLDSFLGLIVGMAMLLPFYMLGGTGAGDVKLLGVVGALLGAKGAVVAGIATFISGGVLGALWILYRLVEPYITAEWSRLTGSDYRLPPINTQDVQIRGSSFPYAPAIAGGSCLAIWYLGLLGPVIG